MFSYAQWILGFFAIFLMIILSENAKRNGQRDYDSYG